MTTITSDYTDARFSNSDSAQLLIDHQPAIRQLNRDHSPAEFRNNLVASCLKETHYEANINSDECQRTKIRSGHWDWRPPK
jgi:hypothetical protein